MKRSISLSELRESLVYDGSDASSTMGGGGGGGVGMTGLRRVRSHENLGMASEESPPPAQAGGARAPILSEQDLREHFNMPLNEVAKKFGMCTTALKKLCRKYGVMQWPHRKLRSLEKKIASLRAEQRYTTDGRGHLDDEIRKLEVQREALITGTGEMPEGDPAWSPTPGSPYEDQADMGHAGNAHMMGNGGNAHRHSPTPARAGGQAHGAAGAAGGTPPASKAKGGAAGGGPRGGAGDSSSKALNLQIKTLEEENASLRALSRALMAERQDLVYKLDSSSGANAQIESLRQLCSSLQQQLRAAALESQGPMGGYKEEDIGEGIGQDLGEARRKGLEEELYHDMPGWGPSGTVDARPPGHIPGASPHSKMQRWPGGQGGHHRVPHMHDPGIGGGVGQGSGQRLPLPTDGGGDLHSLSWMAPDFDLDELI